MIFDFLKQHKIDAYIAIGLFGIALLPRVLGLGLFLTADEKNWIGRSYEFIRAFHDLRFNDMLQTTHPGVPTLWVSGIAVMAKSALSQVPYASSHLIYFVKTTQFSIALLNAIAIPFIFIFLLVLCKNRYLSILATLFIALDPFIIGYSRVVHVDVLMSSFLTLAVLATILYARTVSRSWLVTSAVLSVLAILTKVPAIFIMPFIFVALLLFQFKKLATISFLKDRLKDAIIWILFGVVITLIIWPALLWVPNPAGNLNQINKDISTAAITPHDSNENYNIDPLHYPYALLDRSNPVSLVFGSIGLLVVIIMVAKKKIPKEMLLIVVYLIGFTVFMTLGAKKGDRYIMASFFALDILAAYGVWWVASFANRFLTSSPSLLLRKEKGVASSFPLLTKERLGEVSSVGLITALLSTIYLFAVVISYHPYEISYSNPFFRDNLSQELGWGEGLNLVADWLNKNDSKAIVASWYPEELGTFTSATVLHINAHAQNPVNYIVLYKNMFGREPAHYANDFIDEYYKKRIPVFTAQVSGKDYAWVYAKPSYTGNIGALDAGMIVMQDIEIAHNDMAGFQFLPATHFGKSDTGSFVISVSKTLNGPAVFTKNISVTDVQDTQWQEVLFPDSLKILKGEHIFISIRGIGTTDPYPSIRYSQKDIRTSPMYISRTGNPLEAKEKPGTLGIQLLYNGTNGKIATELEEKLLK